MRKLFAFLSLIAVLGFGSIPAPAVLAQSGAATSGLVDLPGIALTPGDASAAGIPDLGRFENGHFRSLEEYSTIRSDFLNLPLADAESALSEAGYLQGYTSNLGLPQEPGNPESPPSRVVFSSIYQFETAEGAAAAWAFNTRYDGVTIATVDTSITSPTPIGDQAVMTRTTAVAMEEEGPSDQIDTLFQIGNIIAATGIIDYGMSVDAVENPEPPDPEIVAQVEQLAARLIERIEAAQNGEMPSLSLRALALSSKIADPGFTSEGYRRIAGEDIPYYNGYEDDLGQYTTAEVTSVYEVGQGLGSLDADPFDPYFASRLFNLTDEATAATFLLQIPDKLTAGFTVVDPASPLSGDGALLVEYAYEVGPGLVAQGYQVWQQSGSVVAMFFLESADHRPSPDAVFALAKSQIDCLNSGCETMPLPEGW